MNTLLADDGESDSHRIGLLPAPSNLSPIVWDRMVAKAKTIVSDPASMSPIPGSNNKSRFVVSFRNPSSPMKIQAGKSRLKSCLNSFSCPQNIMYSTILHYMTYFNNKCFYSCMGQ